jgi:hypothetical protein
MMILEMLFNVEHIMLHTNTNVFAKPSHETTYNPTIHQDTIMERTNFLSVFGRHLIAMNIHPLRKEKEYYSYSVRAREILHL